MRLYFDIAAVVSLFSVVFIFAKMYLDNLKVSHEREIHDERDWQREERMYHKIGMLEEKIEDLSNNVAGSMDSRPRSRR